MNQEPTDTRNLSGGLPIDSARLHRTKVVSLSLIATILLGAILFSWVVFGARHARVDSEQVVNPPPPVEVAWKNVDAHLTDRKIKRRSGGMLPSPIVATLTSNVRGHFSVYIEDLKTGMWWGIGEKEAYNAWSLLKVSTLVALLKKVEREQISLDEGIVLTPDELKYESSFVTNNTGMGSFRSFSIKELAERMIEDSDDAAAMALCKKLTFEEFQDSFRAMSMPLATPPNVLPLVSPEQYANLLRSLYRADYLDRALCDVALSLMSNTVFTDQIKAGLPRDIQLAHKVGFNAGTGDSHDCGIVFLPNRPYLICVMSTGTTKEEADRVVKTLSSQVYEFMDHGMPVVLNHVNGSADQQLKN